MFDDMGAMLQDELDAFQLKFISTIGIREASVLTHFRADLVSSAIDRLALKTGDIAPDFVLPGANGMRFCLSSALQLGPVILTFYRGAWCPFCSIQLRAYDRVLSHIKAYDGTLVAISPQNMERTIEASRVDHLKFKMLSDLHNSVARAYGLVFPLGQAVKDVYENMGIDLEDINGDDSYELPIPATYVVAQSGVIYLAFVNADYTRRLEPSAIIDALYEMSDQ